MIIEDDIKRRSAAVDQREKILEARRQQVYLKERNLTLREKALEEEKRLFMEKVEALGEREAELARLEGGFEHECEVQTSDFRDKMPLLRRTNKALSLARRS